MGETPDLDCSSNIGEDDGGASKVNSANFIGVNFDCLL